MDSKSGVGLSEYPK